MGDTTGQSPIAERHSGIEVAGGETAFRYWAFLSYSHKDERWAARLHRRLEIYSGHKKLVGTRNSWGEAVPARLFPVFRDREELAAAADLPERIREALRESRFLIVICSPASAASPWVNLEVELFQRLGREQRVLALIVDGEPGASLRLASGLQECFPRALLQQRSALTDDPIGAGALIAADARPGKDGERGAFLKLASALLGVRFDDLRRRDSERQTKRLQWIASMALAGGAVFAGIAIYANSQRLEAEQQKTEADAQRDEAKRQKTEADTQRDEARRQRTEANTQRDEAKRQKTEADTQRDEAKRHRLVAEQRARVALSRQLATQALIHVPGLSADETQRDLARALLLGVHAYRVEPTVEARSVLFRALTVSVHPPQLLWGHAAPVEGVEFSRDGRLLASASADGAVIIWDAKTRKPAATFSGEKWRRVTCMAFSPNAAVLAVGTQHEFGGSGGVQLWDVATQTPIGERLEGHERVVSSVAFSPDGAILASGGGGSLSQSGEVIVWDVARRTPLGPPITTSVPGVTSVAISTDGNTLAIGSGDVRAGSGNVLLWDLAKREAIAELMPANKGATDSLAFSADGASLAAATWNIRDRTAAISLFDVATRKSIEGLDFRPDARVLSLAFSSDGRWLAAGTVGGTVVLWEAETRRDPVRLPAPRPEPVNAVAFSPDSRLLAAGGRTGIVTVWDLTRRTALGEPVPGFRAWISSLAFSPDGATLAAGTKDFAAGTSEVVLLDYPAGTTRAKLLAGRDMGVESVAFSRDGRLLAVGRDEPGKRTSEATVWDFTQGKLRDELRIAQQDLTQSVAFSSDGERLLLSGWESSSIGSISPTQRQGGPSTGERLPGGPSALSPDRKWIALGRRDGTVTLVNTASGGKLRILPGEKVHVTSMAFSPDSGTLAAGGDTGIVFWDISDGPSNAARRVHSGAVTRIAFSGDGRVLAAASKDRVVLFDVASRKRLGDSLLGHSALITGIAFSPDAKTLASASLDRGDEVGEVIFWKIDANTWIARACSMVNRNLSPLEWQEIVGGAAPFEPACPGVMLTK